MPIRAGPKIALLTLVTTGIIVLLCENDILEAGPKNVYLVASMCKDALLLCPFAWEEYLMEQAENLMRRISIVFNKVKNLLCGRADGPGGESGHGGETGEP